MASLHPSKRQFLGPPASQQSITTYFSSSPSYLSTNYDPPTSSHISATYTLYNTPPALSIPSAQQHSPALSSPPLPAAVQSNLLSVGMRVRKSIPEGYKTGTYSAFTLFSESPVSPCTPVPYRPDVRSSGVGDASNGLGHAGKEKKMGRARARELTPFCGILKVGGFAVQDMGMVSESDMGSEECPPLSSQGSTVTVDSWVGSFGSGKSNKRRWECDEDEEAEQERDRAGKRDMGVLGGIGQGFEPNGRTIAVPRKMKGPSKLASGYGDPEVKIVGEMGQEMDPDVDFGEAEFLDYRLVGEEVEMCDA